jgi:hypothetical protein
MIENGPKQIAGPGTHPHLATIELDPALHGRFRDLTDGRPEVVILFTDQSMADRWTVFVGCASAAVADLLESAW